MLPREFDGAKPLSAPYAPANHQLFWQEVLSLNLPKLVPFSNKGGHQISTTTAN
jgi:hypothetical protein